MLKTDKRNPMGKYRFRDQSDLDRILGYVYAENSGEAYAKAKRRWPEKFPLVSMEYMGASDRPEDQEDFGTTNSRK